MNTFKVLKQGVTYTPVEATTYTGSLITLYVDEEKFNRGEPAEAVTLEALRDNEGKITIINNNMFLIKGENI